MMSTTSPIILILVIAIAVIAAYAFMQRRRTERTENYHIRLLNLKEQQRFSELWRQAQARFVDDPPSAIREADKFVCDVMRVRGTPWPILTAARKIFRSITRKSFRNCRSAHEIATMEQEGRAGKEVTSAAYYRINPLNDSRSGEGRRPRRKSGNGQPRNRAAGTAPH